MPCEYVKVGDTWGIVKTTGRRPVFCQFCHQRPATKLCDYEQSTGGGLFGSKPITCDASICDICATKGGKDIDYCPTHKHAAKQGGLFE